MVLASCAVSPVETSGGSQSDQQLIAHDLVSVLVQIDELPTVNTTLNLPADFSGQNQFANALQAQLEDAGYGIRTVGQNLPDKVVSYSIEPGVDEAGEVMDTYTVTIGKFGVRRSYGKMGGAVLKPMSLMSVRGVDASSLRINDDLFSEEQENGSAQVKAVELAPEPATIVEPIAVEEPATIESVVVPEGLYRQPTQNFRELERSNFDELLASRQIVDEAILLFPNDSVRMGGVNKIRIAQFVEQFDPDRDVFSLIGCSNGSTNVQGGSKALALGRAERVRQELLYAGIPDERILLEGCWSDEYYDEMMPRRGVVVSLKRLGA